MIVYDKKEVRNSLTSDDIYDVLQEFGGEPRVTNFGLVSLTICHHKFGEDCSHKLYYYENSKLFKCYTGGCEESTFDIFQLIIKIMQLNYSRDMDLNDAVLWVVNKFGLSGKDVDVTELEKSDEDIVYDRYEEINKLQSLPDTIINLPEFDSNILDCFNYNAIIEPWLVDKISIDAMRHNRIGFYPGQWQVTIPHFDINSRFIGLRGRSLSIEDAQLYGKYRPLKINNILYNHPLGMNLYNINNSKKNIGIFEKAIVFESEKACLRYQTEFGYENDISVACCGSNLSSYQVFLLKYCGAKEIIIAFDRDFTDIGDEKFVAMEKRYRKFYEQYKKDILLSFICDRNKITQLKSSPIDEDKDKFLTLFKERVIL